MEPLTQPNDGSRPSALELDRVLTGELTGSDAARAEAWIEQSETDHLRRTEAARDRLPPLDLQRLRHRAEVVTEVEAIPAPANSPWVQWFGVVGMAAALLLTALPSAPPATSGGSGWTAKGSAVSVFSLHQGALLPYDGTALGQGDVVGFQVSPGSHEALTLLSVDGTGAVSVFYPSSGDQPLSVTPGGTFELPGTITLDGAPGPELFVVVWDRSVESAEESLRAAFVAGGAEGVERWSATMGDVDLVTVQRR